MKFLSRIPLLILLMLSSGCFSDDVAEVALAKLKYSFTLSYNGNGNTSGTVPAEPAVYKYNETVTIPGNTGTLARNGYNFIGWNTSPNGNGKDYSEGMTLSVSGDITLYAKWTTNSVFTVSYNGNGNASGTVPAGPVSYQTGQVVTVLGNINSLFIPGYNFTGWNTDPNGLGVPYPPGSTFFMGNSDVILYAMWSAIPQYSITYDGNGNTSGSTPGTVIYTSGENFTIPGNTGNLMKINRYNSIEVQNASFRFAGWNTSPDGNGTDYPPDETKTVTSDLTLYAKWIPYALGDIGPAGGWIFYIRSSYTSGDLYGDWRYLEEAPADLPGVHKWSETTDTLISDAMGMNAGDGKKNTEVIIATLPLESTAAKVCDDYSINGYDDWFLPSYDELGSMCNEFILNGYGAFTGIEYWSSTQHTVTGNALKFNFGSNEGVSYIKINPYFVRPVRRF